MYSNSFDWESPYQDTDDCIVTDGSAQCPISNACPMDDARECERWGQCYWEEQEHLELDETAEMYDCLI